MSEWKQWLSQVHVDRGDKKGIRYITNLFNTFHGKYTFFLETAVREAVKAGRLDEAIVLGKVRYAYRSN